MGKMPNSHMYKDIKLIKCQVIVKSHTHDRKEIKRLFQEGKLHERDANWYCEVRKVNRVYCRGGIDNCINVWEFFVRGLGSEIFDHLARRDIFLSYGSSYRVDISIWYAMPKGNPDSIHFDIDRVIRFEPVMGEVPALTSYGPSKVPEVTWGKENGQE